jgi:predicted enzyme related to lactoylglutathione lyase
MQGPSRGGTVIYLDIADGVAKALERASKAGGKIVQDRQDLGPHGESALIEDRDGNLIGLHTARA